MVESITYSLDGKRLAASGMSGIYFFDLPIDELMALAKSLLTRTLTTEERRQRLHVATCPSTPRCAIDFQTIIFDDKIPKQMTDTDINFVDERRRPKQAMLRTFRPEFK